MSVPRAEIKTAPIEFTRRFKMTDQIDTQDLIARVDKLERQTRRLKVMTMAFALGIGATMLMGQAGPVRTLEATAFILKDDTGMVRAKLFMDPVGNGPSLSLYDSNGARRVLIFQGSKSDAEGLILYNYPPAQIGDAQVLVTPDGASLNLLSARHGAVSLATNSLAGPGLEIVDGKGFTAEIGVGELDVPATGEKRTTSAASIILHDKNGKVIWSAP
jgi:hypothetical protein